MAGLDTFVTLVTGASRGAGRAIALKLGAAGATVHVTGRSVKETPAYLGRAMVALASDPRVLEKSGQVLEVGALAREYGFTDVDGTQPPPFRAAG